MDKAFSINHPFLYILAGIAVFAVLLQSVVFLKKAWRRAVELGFDKEKLKKTAISAAVFSIAPAIGIGIGIITLSGTLGLPLPWLRLSVVGALTYELTAADAAAGSMGISLGSALTAQQFTTIAWTMTVGIITGLVLLPAFCKKTTQSVSDVNKKDRIWGEHFTNAIFFGLIATFVGKEFAGVTYEPKAQIAALVVLVSALVMCICGILKKKLSWDWLNDYALPLCMIIAMAAAIPITAWLL